MSAPNTRKKVTKRAAKARPDGGVATAALGDIRAQAQGLGDAHGGIATIDSGDLRKGAATVGLGDIPRKKKADKTKDGGNAATLGLSEALGGFARKPHSESNYLELRWILLESTSKCAFK